MNAVDPWAALAAAFPETTAPLLLSPEQIERLREDYEREQIETAQSEMHEANQKEYRK